jgi:8-oxo-dGTP diphosphatase
MNPKEALRGGAGLGTPRAMPRRPKSAPAPFVFAPLTTDRLVLRPFVAQDAGEVHRLLNDWEVCASLADVPYPYPQDKAETWVGFTAQAMAEGREYHLAITGRENDAETLVGAVALRREGKSRTASLGFWVGRRFWGHGVASEAAGRLCRWALANLDIDRITATVATANGGSIAVLRKIGMTHAGEAIQHFLARNRFLKVLVFEATREGISSDGPAVAGHVGPKPLVLVAACALIDRDGRILLARRPEGKKMAGLWEFPGGKFDPGETPEAALIRELREELGIDVASNCLAPFTFASHEYDSFHLLMPLFLCRRWKGRPEGREGQQLAWVRPENLAEYPMPAADLPLVPLLRDFL